MSKFALAIKAKQTSLTVPSDSATTFDYLKIHDKTTRHDISPYETRLIYRIGATFCCEVNILESELHSTKAEIPYMEYAKQALVNELFGEFRDPLYKALGQVTGRDIEGARETLCEIINTMFVEGLEK